MIEGYGEMERTQVLDFTELPTHLSLRHPYERFAVMKGSKCLTDYASVLMDILSFMVLVLSAKKMGEFLYLNLNEFELDFCH